MVTEGEIQLDTSARPQFVLYSAEYPQGLLVRCTANLEMDEWVSSIEQVAQVTDMAMYKRRTLPTWGWW